MIDRQDVLDAAETVVGRDGAANLTLEAVASAAGISKASVLYDYKCKASLIEAVIDRKVKAEQDKVAAERARFDGVSDAALLARVAAAAASLDDATRAVALSLCSALAQDAALRARLQGFYREQVAEVVAQSARPRQALVGFLALEGLKMLECFDFFRWPAAEREQILEDIAALPASTFSWKEASARECRFAPAEPDGPSSFPG